jgi:tubulin polyglutamylase TTLL6/13
MCSFDILIDKKFKPWLLEVNHAPSFNDDTDVDKEVKTNLLTDTLRLLNINYQTKQRILSKQQKELDRKKVIGGQAPGSDSDEEHVITHEQYQLENLGDYKKIYPFQQDTDEQKERWELYENILCQARDIFVKQTGVSGSG